MKMLDEMETDDMYGSPIHKSQLPKGSVCLGTVWTYLIKLVSERKKARNFCDGSVLRRRNQRERGAVPYYKSFSSNATQQEMHIFTAICAHKNYLIGDGDATNAFAQAAPPTEPTFVRTSTYRRSEERRVGRCCT